MPLWFIVVLNMLLHPINSYKYGLWHAYKNDRLIFLPRDNNQIFMADRNCEFKGVHGFGGLLIPKGDGIFSLQWGDLTYTYLSSLQGFSPVDICYSDKLMPRQWLPYTLTSDIQKINFVFPCTVNYAIKKMDLGPVYPGPTMVVDMYIKLKTNMEYKRNNLGIEIVQQQSACVIQPKQYFSFLKNKYDIEIKLFIPTNCDVSITGARLSTNTIQSCKYYKNL